MLEIQLIAVTGGEHYLTFGMGANETTHFELQFWITKYGIRAVDWLQSLSLGWISFMEGDVWIHNQPESIVKRANFFGEQKDAYIGVVANEQPNDIKLLDSIGIHTDAEWEVVSVTIPKTLNNPDGMYSKIPKAWFKRREGVLRAEFLRNMKTNSSTASVLDLLRGEPLRGNAAYVLLKNTSTSQMKLFKIDVNFTTSKV